MSKSYFAFCKCGCGAIVAAVLCDGKYAKSAAADVAKLIREGYAPQLLPSDEIQKHQFGCVKEAAKRSKKKATTLFDGATP